MRESIGQFIASHRETLLARLAEHLEMAGVAVLMALAVGLLISMAIYRRKEICGFVLSLIRLVQTIPGIALLVVMMSLFHRIGILPAIVTLFLFALLPIVQSTTIALSEIPKELEEVARGLGMTNFQRLLHVRLPLALPHMVAGLRVAAVQTVGLTTLAAFIGAGGLGQFINRGLFLSDTRLILLGAIPAALIALAVDKVISFLELVVSPQIESTARRMAAGACAAMLLFTVMFVWHFTERPAHAAITVGSKNFTEQLILAEIIAQTIEHETDMKVERKFGLGGSTILHEALVKGSIDIAVEYTGTALTAILHAPIPSDRAQILPFLKQKYAAFGLTWLEPLGFSNAYGIGIRDDDPAFAGVETISDLAKRASELDAAFDFEFAERPDGYAGLQKAYGLHFRQVRDMQPDLLYDALSNHRIDVISSYTTDGRLVTHHVRVLRDDRAFFPPYEAAIVVSSALLTKQPKLSKVLAALEGKFSEDTMRSLNAAVDAKRMTVEQAAHSALDRLSKE